MLKKMLFTQIMILSVLCVMFLTDTACAQRGFGDNGESFYIYNHKYKFSPVSSGERQLTFVYEMGDTEGFSRIYAQIVSADGELLFGDDPLEISHPRQHAWKPSAVRLSNGSNVVVWTEFIEDGLFEYRAQRIAVNGEMLWGEYGIQIARAHSPIDKSSFIALDDEDVSYITVSVSEPGFSSVYALGADGQFCDNWPGNGFIPDSSQNGNLHLAGVAGFWMLGDYSYNWIRPDGSKKWDTAREFIQSEAMHIPGHLHVLPDYRIGTLYQDPNTHNIQVTVLDTSGEAVVNQVILDAENVPVFTDCAAAIDAQGRFYFACSDINEEDFDYRPAGPPFLILFDSANEDDPFPWTRDGITLSDFYSEVFAGNLALIPQNGRLIIGYRNNILAINTEGDYEWGEEPLPVESDISMNCYGAVCNDDNSFWMNRFYQKTSGCQLISPEGRSLFGERAVRMVTNFRGNDFRNSTSLVDANGDFRQYWITGFKGLAAQQIDSDGQLKYSADGHLIDPDWDGDAIQLNSGFIDNYQWIFQVTNTQWIAILAMLNDNNDIVWTQPLDHDFLNNSDFAGNTAPMLANNNVDEFAILSTNARNGYEIIGLDVDQHITFRQSHTYSVQQISRKNFEWWPGHGWLAVALFSDSLWFDLYDTEGRKIWNEPVGIYRNHRFEEITKIVFTDDQLTAVVLRYEEQQEIYWHQLANISCEGDLLGINNLFLFEEDLPRYVKTDCQSGANGSLWFAVHSLLPPEHSKIQCIDNNLNWVLGDSGLAIPGWARLLPDEEGGSWIFWQELNRVKVQHLDALGRRWRNAFPEDGFNVFNGDDHELWDCRMDDQSHNVYVTSTWERAIGNLRIPGQRRIQLIGNEWVGVNKEPEIVREWSISGNYPNPFNSSTIIPFSLDSYQHVTVKIYDITGRIVSNVADGKFEAGKHSVVWDGRDVSEQEVGSGVYFYRLAAGGDVLAGKLTLLR